MSVARIIGGVWHQTACIIKAWAFDRLVMLAGLT